MQFNPSSPWFRYFFFDWLFKDASHIEGFQKAAALRYNVRQRHYLLLYFKRWIGLTVGTYLIGATLEYLQWPAMCAVFYAMTITAVCTLLRLSVAYVLLGRSP
ncbi:hypothetical protein [Limnobacter sp.]|uniref:hypothetical protein n=1 Tax=Limnobacter sp. TaxID=2003368 RepID=UPI0025836075|nr:hypothetical protein [Limnobacter sp.]HEX5486106.1 hypothetical protein [Limnobacter sp.]